MDKSLIELLGKISADKELVSEFAESLKTGKHLNITGLCAEQKVFVAMALAYLHNAFDITGLKAVHHGDYDDKDSDPRTDSERRKHTRGSGSTTAVNFRKATGYKEYPRQSVPYAQKVLLL